MAVSSRLAAPVRALRQSCAVQPERNLINRKELLDNGESVAISNSAADEAMQASSGGNQLLGRIVEGGGQDFLWQKFFSDPALWWDNRRSKENPRHADFVHKKSQEALWLRIGFKPAWVESQLALLDARVDAGMRKPPVSVSTWVQGACSRLAARGDDVEIGMCKRLCELGQVTEAVDGLDLLVQRGCHIPNNLFYCLLKRCITQKDLALGRRIHALSVESGYEGNAFVATHLIGLYASHGRLGEAMRVFSKVATPSAHNWASIILAYARHGEPAQAIHLYRQMCESTVKPGNRTFVAVLKACASGGDLAAGKDVHDHIRASAVKPDVFVQTCLVDMYAKCGSLAEARAVFDSLSQKDVVTWTAMIAGYVQDGMAQEAFGLYSSMQQEGIVHPNSVTYTCLLQACASAAALPLGKQLHAQIEERGLQADVVVGTNLVNMYAKCGSLLDAQRVFDRLSEKNVVTWNAMITGYAQHGMSQEALNCFCSMQQGGTTPPDSVTFVCILQACASIGLVALQQGKQLHVQIEERGVQNDVTIGNSLVNMYAKCGSLEDARTVFDGILHKDVVTWNAMIAGYAQQGMCKEAFSLYTDMQKEGITPPDSITFVCLLQACASVAALHQGKQLHDQIQARGLQADVVIGNSLVNMYAKCGSLEDARRIFDRLSQKDVVTWNAMIAGYAQKGLGQEALGQYRAMQQQGTTPPDVVTFVCLLQACANVAALPLGNQLHAQIEERGLQDNAVVGPSLINMYAKCGTLDEARRVFDGLTQKDVFTWNALIAGYARQGDGEIVFELVHRMKLEGIKPDSITFLSVLTVCSHVGLVDKGRKYFEAMSTDYGITPSIEHYRCMMDLVGRAGHLDEALQMVRTMPFQPNGAVWRTLLGACCKWSNVEVGLQAFEFAIRLDQKDSAAYVLMSNIYASAEMWEEANEMQARRKNLGAWKQLGQSWSTDMDGVVHSFVV